MSSSPDRRAYWRANVRFAAVLLSIWFIVGYGFSIFFIQWLNRIPIGNVGAGFWFAQQGSIFVFVLLVLAYALGMDYLDRKHGVDE